MITIKALKRKSPKDGSYKYYVQKETTNTYTLSNIIKGIEKSSTVASADVKAVLDALQEEIITALQNGASVRLGDLGSFNITITSKGVATEDEVTTDNINRVKVQFTPSVKMKKALQPATGDVSFKKVSNTASTDATADDEDPNA